MAKKICDYCSKVFDEEYFEALDNGCPACAKCVEEEQKREEEKEKNERKH